MAGTPATDEQPDKETEKGECNEATCNTAYDRTSVEAAGRGGR